MMVFIPHHEQEPGWVQYHFMLEIDCLFSIVSYWKRLTLSPQTHMFYNAPLHSLAAPPWTGRHSWFNEHWGGSSAGSALRSQCRGRGFDPLPLHQSRNGRNFRPFSFMAGTPTKRFCPVLL